MVLLGFFFTFTLSIQIKLGYKVLKAALTALPIAISIGFLSQKLTRSLGRQTVTLGAVANVFFTYGQDVQPWQFILGLLLTNNGMGINHEPLVLGHAERR